MPRGTVTAVDGGKVTVKTDKGEETFQLKGVSIAVNGSEVNKRVADIKVGDRITVTTTSFGPMRATATGKR